MPKADGREYRWAYAPIAEVGGLSQSDETLLFERASMPSILEMTVADAQDMFLSAQHFREGDADRHADSPRYLIEHTAFTIVREALRGTAG